MNEKKGKKCFDPKVSIILPTYNESENIGFLIDEISELLKNKNYEIIVVDDAGGMSTEILRINLLKPIN